MVSSFSNMPLICSFKLGLFLDGDVLLSALVTLLQRIFVFVPGRNSELASQKLFKIKPDVHAIYPESTAISIQN
ncbi:hypothetical protein OIU79_002988 [Salix purpurea]|uniref:Uncharacterized protein n=1 Tax=Salix purpurea TaxID=77065 RepID=A0A9Q0UKE6_SALPP|nr:hypothetical protein OIU79_002988 [Salix purpurea]